MKQPPLNNMFGKVMKDLQGGIESAMNHLQEGMQEYLTNSINLDELLDMVQKMGISNIMGMKGATMPGFDAYRILGLDKTATNEEIKQRYRSLLSKLHPDVAGIKGTEFLTQMIVMAYEIIEKERGWS